jgi:hypothetical protein
MPRHTRTLLLVAALLAAPGQSAVRAGDKAAPKIDPRVVAEQKAAALKNWKRAFDKADPPQHETDHFLLLGTVEGRTLKQVGEALEKAHELARKALDLTKEEPWPGKLTVYFGTDRRTFAALVRNVEKRRPDPAEHGSVLVRSDTPSVIAGPGKEAYELNAEGEAAAQIAAALLLAKAGAMVPAWLTEGFGRATALRAGPPEALAQEHRRAQAIAGKRKARDAWGDGLGTEEAPVLRASVMEYLAYSGRIPPRVFLPFVTGFRPREEGQAAPNTDAVLSALNISAARLNDTWQKWLRMVR